MTSFLELKRPECTDRNVCAPSRFMKTQGKQVKGVFVTQSEKRFTQRRQGMKRKKALYARAPEFGSQGNFSVVPAWSLGGKKVYSLSLAA